MTVCFLRVGIKVEKCLRLLNDSLSGFFAVCETLIPDCDFKLLRDFPPFDILFQPFDNTGEFAYLPLRFFEGLPSYFDFTVMLHLQVLKPSDFLRQFVLLFDARVPGCRGADFRGADGKFTADINLTFSCRVMHGLINKPRFALLSLPEQAVKRVLRHVVNNADFGIQVSLSENSPFPLFDIAGSVRAVQMMERVKMLLVICPDAALACGRNQHTDFTAVDIFI